MLFLIQRNGYRSLQLAIFAREIPQKLFQKRFEYVELVTL